MFQLAARTQFDAELRRLRNEHLVVVDETSGPEEIFRPVRHRNLTHVE